MRTSLWRHIHCEHIRTHERKTGIPQDTSPPNGTKDHGSLGRAHALDRAYSLGSLSVRYSSRNGANANVRKNSTKIHSGFATGVGRSALQNANSGHEQRRLSGEEEQSRTGSALREFANSGDLRVDERLRSALERLRDVAARASQQSVRAV